jgi:chromosomal replication initiation ATPase DnaA
MNRAAELSRQQCLIDLQSFCDRHHISFVNVVSKRKDRQISKNRKACAEYLKKRGHSLVAIGFAMQKDHSSIIYLLDADKRRKRRKIYAESRVIKGNRPYLPRNIDT